MEEEENKSKNDYNLIAVLANSSLINNKYSVWIFGIIFSIIFLLAFWIFIYMLIYQKSIETWILELILANLWIIFTVSYFANEAKKQKTPEYFAKKIFEDFKEDKNFLNKEWFNIYNKKVKEKGKEYKDLLMYKDYYIWINLKYDNFYIRVLTNWSLEKLLDNWAIKINSFNAWLWKNSYGSYEEKKRQLKEYMDFLENALNK